MITIDVNTSRNYQIHIASELISQIDVFVKKIKDDCKIAIISDSNVWPLYGDKISTSLSSAGFDHMAYIMPAGEESKNSDQYLQILNFLADNAITRSDLLIALGGGVVGDMTGFVAATYLRGIAYVQVPTSLLAMVDSSVGGKTAIDLPAGKNLVGAFNQPAMVLCDLSALETLPKDVFIDGCAEVIKYGVLYDTELFGHLMQNGPEFDREYVITRCVELKRNTVVADEFDTGARQLLNLGHTIGHSIEKCSNYRISHGYAVAAGMSIIAKASAALGYCSFDIYTQICDIMTRFSLPTSTAFLSDALNNNALSDKKRLGQSINLVLPRKIGECFLCKTPVEELKSFIEAGL